MPPLTPDQLLDLEVLPWRDCAGDFQGAPVVLGNGFSINLEPRFSYPSLFNMFLNGSQDRAALVQFATTNFELILERLQITAQVNGILQLPIDPATRLATSVREGLITTVEAVHPRKDQVHWTKLERVLGDLDQFSDIFSLNYDALLYHMIMRSKDRYVPGTANRYNDFFWHKRDTRHLQFRDFQEIRDYKHVYYLHGALFLFRLADQAEGTIDVKIRTPAGAELLTAIADEIRRGSLPLFISEGDSRQKLEAIKRSDYLTFSLAALKQSRPRLVVYGATLGPQDKHIAAAICRGTQRVAVSVYVGNKTETDLEAELHLFRASLAGVETAFFDSQTLFA